jgi:hypothetical protein
MCTSRLLGAVCASVVVALSSTIFAAPVSEKGTWETTLLLRDLDDNPSTIETDYYTDVSYPGADAKEVQRAIVPPPFARLNLP